MPVAETISSQSSRTIPTRWGSIVFAGKVWGLRARRLWIDRSATVRRFEADTEDLTSWPVGHELESPLWLSEDPRERSFEQGKVQNLRLACASLDGIVLEAGDVFSFWKQVGRASRSRGFVVGRMLQQGCIIPAIGGGLCQLSNALYGLALTSRYEIVERHAHSVKVPGAPIHDATVAWNYVDLRFRVRQRTRIVATMTENTLTVGFRFHAAVEGGLATLPLIETAIHAASAQSCSSCGEGSCFRHEPR